MASDGLTKYAKNGKCRMCLRVRKTDLHLKIVGEVRHGYATGHIWECIDTVSCDHAIQNKLDLNHRDADFIQFMRDKKIGRAKEYIFKS